MVDRVVGWWSPPVGVLMSLLWLCVGCGPSASQSQSALLEELELRNYSDAELYEVSQLARSVAALSDTQTAGAIPPPRYG
jgi:hypothetical protein